MKSCNAFITKIARPASQTFIIHRRGCTKLAFVDASGMMMEQTYCNLTRIQYYIMVSKTWSHHQLRNHLKNRQAAFDCLHIYKQYSHL